MQYIQPQINTLALGSAWAEAAMLLCAGEPGHRCALTSSTLMIRQPMQYSTQMQASDIDIYRHKIRNSNAEINRVLSRHTGHKVNKIYLDMTRTLYFTPEEAIEYGLIDHIMRPENKAA